LRFGYVIIVKNGKLASLDCRVVPQVYELVIVEFGLAAGLQDRSTGRTDNFEGITQLVLTDKDERFTIAIKALKSFENDITHAFHMSGPDLV
jgi:hypothetical protein